VIIVDANVLLNAINSDSPDHVDANHWLDEAMVGDEAVGLPWLCLIAFTRLATRPSIFPAPWSSDAALDQVENWLAAPAVTPCNPGTRHLSLWRELLHNAGIGGNLVNDAHLAALALENNATVVTFDTDFARFPAVAWRTPTQLLAR